MNEHKPKHVLVGMSGGLDSAYTALDYKERGFHVEGAVLRMSDETDIAAAQVAADQVGVALHIIDAREAFSRYVKRYFAESYAHGRTPNPCVICNRYVKIEYLCAYAREHGIPRVSTGHYAYVRRDAETGFYYVRAADDVRKDQSYFLWQLTQEQLSMLETPLADRDKTQIRAAAYAKGLTAASASESQDICFLPGGDYRAFVEEMLGTFPPGDFVDETGAVVGTHSGIIRYTVGQRKGLGIALGHPVFVTKIDAETNTVHLAPAGREYADTVYVSGIVCQQLPREQLVPGLSVMVKIRYAARPAAAVVTEVRDDGITMRFSSPVRAVTPGQSAVFYDAAEAKDVLFGGWIV